MRMLCPNLDREDSLDTVLEVPIPEEMFPSTKTRWQVNIKYWMIKPTTALLGVVTNTPSPPPQPNSFPFTDRSSQIQLLLGVIGAPLIPLPIPSSPSSLSLASSRIPSPGPGNKHHNSIEASMAKYIVQQYVAAMGGDHALNSIHSMYAMGKVKMSASEFSSGEGVAAANNNGTNANTNNSSNKLVKVKGMRHDGEIGGFVLWQKSPDLWCIELVVSGCKISAGSDGKVAWRQTPWHHSHASRGPPRPLRRSLQGLDPRLTATLFSNSVCIGDKSINGDECFILKLEAQPTTLQARSSTNVDVIRHTVWGYFSQRTGLLIHLEDTHLLRIKPPRPNNNTTSYSSIFWETTMESSIGDYRTIDGVNIAHSGRTAVSLFRYGDHPDSGSRTRMEELWQIEEVDFNIKGLEMDCFLPPSDINKEDDEHGFVEGQDQLELKREDEEEEEHRDVPGPVKVPMFKTVLPAPSVKSRPPKPARISLAKIMAIDDQQESYYYNNKASEDHHQL